MTTFKNILSNNLGEYKHCDTYITDPSNDTNVRIFRDLVTDIYTKTFFEDKRNLYTLLDYTYHELYSSVILGVGAKIHKLNNNNNYDIRPLYGSECIYLIFKGGTVMNLLFNDAFDEKRIEQTQLNITDDNITPFNYDIISNTTPDGSTNDVSYFFKNYIKKNFAVSDTDYSLYIYTHNNERFSMIKKIAVESLADGFEAMTDFFDRYLTFILENQNEEYVYNLPHANIPNTNNEKDHSFNLLRNLKENLSKIRTSEINNNMENLNIKIPPWIINTNNINNCLNLHSLYNFIQHVDLLIYINKLNPNLSNILGNVNLGNIRTIIQKRITDLIEKKKANLVNNYFYTQEKIQKFMTNLRSAYDNIQNDKNANKHYFTDKIEIKKVNYNLDSGVEKKIYKLQKYDNNHKYHNDDFKIVKRYSTTILANNENIYDIVKIQDTDTKKHHYITYNNMISTVTPIGLISDFDLMRSKFNVTFRSNNILVNGEIPIKNINIPAEFIDVSIPSYYDTKMIKFFQELEDEDFVPSFMRIESKDMHTIQLYAYNNKQLTADIYYILFNENYVPWLDSKYKKRIIRALVHFMLNSITYNGIRSNIVYDRNIFLFFINLNKELYNFLKTPSDQLIEKSHKLFETLVSLYEFKNEQDGLIFLKLIQDNFFDWFVHLKTKLIDIPIKKEYKSFEYFIKFTVNILMAYHLPENEFNIFLNFMVQQRNIKRTTEDINQIKQNIISIYQINYDYGTKLLYLYDHLYNQHDQKGGEYDSYMFNKYIKYKTKYLRNKK